MKLAIRRCCLLACIRRSARADRKARRAHRGRRQGVALLPAADDRRAAGLLQGRRLNVQISDFAGGARSLRAVVGRQRRRGLGRLRAHHQHAVAEAVPSRPSCCSGAAPQISVRHRQQARRTTSRPKDLKGLKVGVSAPGSSTNIVVKLLLAKGGLEADGCGDHRRRYRRNGDRRDEEQGRVDVISQYRSGDDDAREGRQGQGDRRHAHAEGHRATVRRADAGG